MRIERHPDVSTLLTCAAGSQPEALCAVVASHISVCPKCFKALSGMHDVGVALFDTITPALLLQPTLTPSLVEPQSSVVGHHTAIIRDSEIPPPLQRVLGTSLDTLPWSLVAPGIEQYVVPLSPSATGDLRILKIERGARIPAHGHQGEELSMVLRGACRDAVTTYSVGDVMDLDDETHHEVVAGDTVGCILIIGSECIPAFATTWTG